jgi:hypothetical protein
MGSEGVAHRFDLVSVEYVRDDAVSVPFEIVGQLIERLGHQ